MHHWDLIGVLAGHVGLGYVGWRSGAVALLGGRANLGAGVSWRLLDLGVEAWWSPKRDLRLDARALALLGRLGPDADLSAGVAWTPRGAAVRVGARATRFAGQWLVGPELALAWRLDP